MSRTTARVSGVAMPQTCTLPTTEQPLRLAEFDDLFATEVLGVVHTEPARAADLVVRETQCCSFFTFTLTATGGRLALSISVPAAHANVLDALAARAAGAAHASGLS